VGYPSLTVSAALPVPLFLDVTRVWSGTGRGCLGQSKIKKNKNSNIFGKTKHDAKYDFASRRDAGLLQRDPAVIREVVAIINRLPLEFQSGKWEPVDYNAKLAS
jgi:hypothetical protein